MKQNYWKILGIAFLVSISFALIGCEKGAVEGSTATDDHVSGEGNQGLIEDRKDLMAKLTGIVLSNQGTPLADATVSAYDKTTTTSASGLWVLNDVPVSDVDVTQQLDGNVADLLEVIPVSIQKEGYTSATVYVGTTAVISDSAHEGADVDGGGDSGSAEAPNTVVVSGLIGTSGDVVLNALNNTIVGSLRNVMNGVQVANLKLSLVPAAAVIAKGAGAVIPGMDTVTAMTDDKGSFAFENVAANTAYTININSVGWKSSAPPVAGATNDAAGNPNGFPGGDGAEDTNQPVALAGVGGNWTVNAGLALNLQDITVSLGALWVQKVTNVDNINPYIANVLDTFEMAWQQTAANGTRWIQYDDTVDFVTVPAVIKFSEPINPDRFDIAMANQTAGKPVSILAFQRDLVKTTTSGNCLKLLDAGYPNAACTDTRIYVSEKTTLVGDTLTLYLESTPVDGYLLDILFKESDIRDFADEPNYLSTPPNTGYYPELTLAGQGVKPNTLTDDRAILFDPATANVGNYSNYWKYGFSTYREPFTPEPPPVLPRPVLKQVTCTDVLAQGNADSTKDISATTGVVADLPIKEDANSALISGLCDIADDVAVVSTNQALTAQKDKTGTVTGDTRLTALVKAYANTDDSTFDAWEAEGTMAVNSTAVIEVSDRVTADATYSVTITGSTLTADDVSVTTGSVAVAEDGSITLVGADKGQRLILKNIAPATKVLIKPVTNAAGETVGETVANDENNELVIDDLTPPMVAIQSENYDPELVALGGQAGVDGVGEVPGEILVPGVEGVSASYLPGLRLTASLYDSTTRRASRTAAGNTVPLLAMADGLTDASEVATKVYTAADFTNWEDNVKGDEAFSKTVRDVIIEMTEEMEGDLTYNVSGGNGDIHPLDTDADNKFNRDANDHPVLVDAAAGIDNTANFAAFVADNIEAGFASLIAELKALYSIDSGNSFIVATLDDWRYVGNKSKMTVKGLRDKTLTEVVNKDTGVIFLDRTPPMARTIAITEDTLTINFDQPLQLVADQTLMIKSADESLKYTITFAETRSDMTGTVAEGTIARDADFTDARGNTVAANATTAIVVNNIDNAGTMAADATRANTQLVLKLKAVDKNVATINLLAYFDKLGNTPIVSWPGVADTTRVENRWGVITAAANAEAATIADKNDAYVCSSTGECVDPAIQAADVIGPKLAYSNIPTTCHDTDLSNGLAAEADDSASDTGTRQIRTTCAYVNADYYDGNTPTGLTASNTQRNYVSVDVLHVNVKDANKSTQVNHWLPVTVIENVTSSDGIDVDKDALIEKDNNLGGTSTGTSANEIATLKAYLEDRNEDNIWSAADSGLETIRFSDSANPEVNLAFDGLKTDLASDYDAAVDATDTRTQAAADTLVSVSREEESYEIVLNFRESIRCQDKVDKAADGTADGNAVATVGTACANITAKVVNTAAPANVLDGGLITEDYNAAAAAGSTQLMKYSDVTVTYVSATSVKVNFGLKDQAQALVGDSLRIMGIKDVAGNVAGADQDGDTNVVSLTLRGADNGIQILPERVVF